MQRVEPGIYPGHPRWGLEQGKYKLAQSNQEVVKTNIQEGKIDSEPGSDPYVAQSTAG